MHQEVVTQVTPGSVLNPQATLAERVLRTVPTRAQCQHRSGVQMAWARLDRAYPGAPSLSFPSVPAQAGHSFPCFKVPSTLSASPWPCLRSLPPGHTVHEGREGEVSLSKEGASGGMAF